MISRGLALEVVRVCFTAWAGFAKGWVSGYASEGVLPGQSGGSGVPHLFLQDPQKVVPKEEGPGGVQGP